MILDHLMKYDIILASQSPRRRELLEGLGVEFEVKTMPDVDESYPDTLEGGDIPIYISQQKCKAFEHMMTEKTLLITADTIVWMKGEVFGKPNDREHAIEMLKTLSGRTHQVYTGVTIATLEGQKSFAVETSVQFATLSNDEIAFYVDSFKPFDKAGSYGVQEWIGYIGVEKIEGSYFNVMGLPIQRLYQELKKY